MRAIGTNALNPNIKPSPADEAQRRRNEQWRGAARSTTRWSPLAIAPRTAPVSTAGMAAIIVIKEGPRRFDRASHRPTDPIAITTV